MKPILGITADVHDDRHRVGMRYTDAITNAGGIPCILPSQNDAIDAYIEMCDGFVFTGGDDPIMEDWGIQTHPNATPVQKRRQEFELSLLRALQRHSDVPVLGVCLGMQWMGLLAGGTLNQDLEEPLASNHTKCTHVVSGSIGEGIVHSHHHQAIEDSGCMEVIGSSPDGVIEAIQDTSRYWYKGVQWHPERTQDKMLGQHLFDDIVIACKKFSS